MSWYTDPQLFICYWDAAGYYVNKVVKKYNVALVSGDIASEGRLDFSKHLSLGNNKESDYDGLKSCLAKNVTGSPYYRNVKFVNCQGLVAHWDYSKSSGIWSTQVEELTSIVNSLPGIVIKPSDTELAEKLQAVEKKNSELIAGYSNLQEQLNQEKSAKLALEKQVLDLTAKLEECLCAGSGSANLQPWMSGATVPDHWVPFEDLDVQNFPKNTSPTAIMEGPNKQTFVEDVITTNVQADRFYRGTFLVAVNVSELTPEKENARFDPEFWGLYKDAGISYAARKPLKSEVSV